jgi:hypothetical protein
MLFGQLLLIPGMAALLSCFMCGPRGRVRRILGILALGILGVPAAVALLIAHAVILDWIFSVTWESRITTVVFILLLLVVVCSITWGLFVLVRKAVRRSVQFDARNWLASRKSEVDIHERCWRIRGVRVASWIPLLTVLCVFLFLPEVWGILSHVAAPHAGRLPAYRVSIPIAWIVLGNGDYPSEGRAWVTGLAGRGIGLGPTSYLHLDFPLWEWRVGTLQHKRCEESGTLPRVPKDAHIVEKRTLKIGSAGVMCVEYSTPYPCWDIESPSAVFIDCSGSTPVEASFVGKRIHVGTFYKMLEGIRAEDPGVIQDTRLRE